MSLFSDKGSLSAALAKNSIIHREKQGMEREGEIKRGRERETEKEIESAVSCFWCPFFPSPTFFDVDGQSFLM